MPGRTSEIEGYSERFNFAERQTRGEAVEQLLLG